MPTADKLAGAPVILFGRICEHGTPRWDPAFTNATCDGGTGTTAQVSLELQTGADANHNPVADHALALEGSPGPRPRPAPIRASRGRASRPAPTTTS